MEGLERLMAGRTTFIIAHRLSTVRQADLILVLHDGQIVEQGTYAGLLRKQGVFASLYKAQFTRRQGIRTNGKTGSMNYTAEPDPVEA